MWGEISNPMIHTYRRTNTTMAWCCQSTRHGLNQRWTQSISPYAVTKLQCFNALLKQIYWVCTYWEKYRDIMTRRIQKALCKVVLNLNALLWYPLCLGCIQAIILKINFHSLLYLSKRIICRAWFINGNYSDIVSAEADSFPTLYYF